MTGFFSDLKINMEHPCYKYILLNRTLNYNYLEAYPKEERRER